MSRDIYHYDQCKLHQIFEQVEALSDVMNELQTELNDLRKISFNVNNENVFFESTKANNKVDCVSPNILQKVKTHVRKVAVSTETNETYRIAPNIQACVCTSYSIFPNHSIRCRRKRNRKPLTIRFSMIYNGLKFFKNKIIKNVGNVQKIERSPIITKHKCVMFDQQEHMYLLHEEQKQNNLCKSDTRNEDNVNIHTHPSLTADASAQAEIAVWQDNGEKSSNCNYFSYRNMINNVQINPLSMISDKRSMIHADRFAEELSKDCIKQTLLRNKIKKYKKCSCGEQCLYALYKLPCNKRIRDISGKKVNYEISGLTLECLSIGKRNNFPKFVNVNTIQERNDKCFVNVSSAEIEANKSSSLPLSVDLEVDIHNDHCNLENIDEFCERRKARTYIVNKTSTREDNPIQNFETENESSFNIISTRSNINEKRERFVEIVENVPSQKKHVNSQENHQELYKKSRTASFIVHWPIKNNDKQVQCAICLH